MPPYQLVVVVVVVAVAVMHKKMVNKMLKENEHFSKKKILFKLLVRIE